MGRTVCDHVGTPSRAMRSWIIEQDATNARFLASMKHGRCSLERAASLVRRATLMELIDKKIQVAGSPLHEILLGANRVVQPNGGKRTGCLLFRVDMPKHVSADSEDFIAGTASRGLSRILRNPLDQVSNVFCGGKGSVISQRPLFGCKGCPRLFGVS